jgi:hypothetical protein
MPSTHRFEPNSDKSETALAIMTNALQPVHAQVRRRRVSTRGALLAVAALVVLLAAGGYAIWTSNVATPAPEALAALVSDDRVLVTEGSSIEFAPRAAEPTTGLVLYPGALVDARAYASAARKAAEQGYFVAIVDVPLDFAILSPDRAADVIAAHPEVRSWAVGGHSLGGVAASSFAKRHPDEIAGLALWASYPAESDDLSVSRLAVVSISGANDGLSTPAKIAASRRLLPPETRYVTVAGGNHSQFGRYGPQRGDGRAEIGPSDQEAQVVAGTVDLLRAIGPRP